MEMSRPGRTATIVLKRRSVSRSTSRAPKRVLTRSLSSFARRTYALAGPNVGLGASATTVLRTSFFANVTATAGTGIATFFLKPGSAFDPAGDLAAIQPQMFDSFAAQYNRYKVNNCKIRMKITGNNGLNGAVWVGAAYPAVDPTALTTYQGAASQQYSKTTSGAFQIQNATGLGCEGKYLSFNLKHDSIVGTKGDAYDVGALISADPTALQFMVLPVFLQVNTAGAATWVVEIDMYQNVTFSQKKNVVDA